MLFSPVPHKAELGPKNLAGNTFPPIPQSRAQKIFPGRCFHNSLKVGPKKSSREDFPTSLSVKGEDFPRQSLGPPKFFGKIQYADFVHPALTQGVVYAPPLRTIPYAQNARLRKIFPGRFDLRAPRWDVPNSAFSGELEKSSRKNLPKKIFGARL